MLSRAIPARRSLSALVGSTRGMSGTVGGGSKAFGNREKGQEDDYARKHEAEVLKKFRESINAKKAELEKLEKEHAEVVAKQDKK